VVMVQLILQATVVQEQLTEAAVAVGLVVQRVLLAVQAVQVLLLLDTKSLKVNKVSQH